MAQVKIIPAVLTNDPQELSEKIQRLEGISDCVQIDIIDGVFADNKTVNPTAMEHTQTNLQIDYHLMVKQPVEWVYQCVQGHANRVIGQVETMWSQKVFVDEVKAKGLKVGLALDLPSPVSKLDSEVLYEVDVVLVMSVRAGFGGQEFEQSILQKIEELDHIRARDNLSFAICDDGGITLSNIDDVHIDGVDEVVIGKRIFEGDIKTNIERFQKAAHGVQ